MSKVIVTTATELENLIQDSIRKVLKENGNENGQDKSDQILNITEAALFLKTAKQTIYGYTSKRLIPFIKKGKKILFRKSDLEIWLNDGKKKSISEMDKDLEDSGNE